MKTYKINEENMDLRYMRDGLIPETITIDFGFKEDGDYTKFLTLQKDTDIKISYFELENDSNIINLYIDKENIIYPIFDKFLSNEDNIRINSDDKRLKNIKYLDVKKRKGDIKLKFVNKDNNTIDKHNIFIKNIMYDLRSKEENNKIKDRLLGLFSDFELLFEQKSVKGKVMEYKIG